MIRISHLNCGWLHKPPFPPACCHCLLVESAAGIALIDTGIGMHDVDDPHGRIGPGAVDAMGFQFHASTTAVKQLEARGIAPSQVGHIVLTHCDSDHVGGLSDFPDAQVHVALEEKQSVEGANPRYTPNQFSHGPQWKAYQENDADFFGSPARSIDAVPDVDIRLVPLFGHTAGHCGVALRDGDAWLLHVGDAYYLRAELTEESHPVGQLAAAAAVNNDLRLASLNKLRQLTAAHCHEMAWVGYHDTTELPADIPQFDQ